ncbi:MAG: chorismate synthase [Synergistaceae bacterium]|jgi:chorismate synthase|nr:chorismate synthase [Synergistaceae bacterium]
MNAWGNRLKLSIFGESHGPAIGIVIDGLPAGEAIDAAETAREMARRAPGGNDLSTARNEPDEVVILSGILRDKTTGAPVCGVIYNRDARSRDYDTILRPGHADWTALLKFGGYADLRGGGHFSGRLTAPLVFAGSIAKQILSRRGVEICARITAIGGVSDEPAREEYGSASEFRAALAADFPASAEIAEAMKAEIRAAKERGDSVGGVVEAAVFGLRGGIGEPFFGSMESAAASLLFSIPAVKGVEFGRGFRLASMRGSEANDAIRLENGRIVSRTNNSGGILGGITNGMPIVARAAFKPTASIALPQESVDAASKQETTLRILGRHDPCVAPRAVPAVEASLALCALDGLLVSGDGLLK